MENKVQTNEGFFDKTKKGISKFFKGIKNFFVKTGRVNGTHCYGIIEGIGDFIVYDDHALISAVGMEDVVFKNENVITCCFEGLGKIRRKGGTSKATVKYSIKLDDKVVFPQKVQEKNDVRNLVATIFAEKDREHFWGSGTMEYGQANRGLYPIEDCDVYGYDNCIVIVLKLQRVNGDKTEKYEESLLYPFANIKSIADDTAKPTNGKPVVVEFDDGKSLRFNVRSEAAYEKVKKIEIGK